MTSSAVYPVSISICLLAYTIVPERSVRNMACVVSFRTELMCPQRTHLMSRSAFSRLRLPRSLEQEVQRKSRDVVMVSVGSMWL